MTAKTKIFLSNSTDPWFNLATEDWIFQDLEGLDQVLFLWRNRETVVIGRSQNPWIECKLNQMEQDGVLLARRQSGGGAVYHDLGNTNFTFLSKKPDYDKRRNLSIVISALASLGVGVHFSGRNDLLLDEDRPRKVSGNAFKEKADRAFHHGTLLINADLDRLNNYLNPPKKKLEAKGVSSVRSRVANMSEVNLELSHSVVCQAIMQSFNATYQCESAVTQLSPAQLGQIDSLNDHYQHLRSWQWRFGQTLPFTHQFDCRFEWGGVDVQLVVKKAVIEDAKIYTDALQPEWLENIAANLVSLPYDLDSVDQAIGGNSDLPERKQVEEFSAWIKQQLA